MAIFKCKMCGGDLEINEEISVCECEYCGTKQTVPRAIEENMQNLFNRANTLRIKGEFDKAEDIYEKIISADSKQSEAYWGLILCKYGIEYVDDPQTFKKVPTCHRASYDSVIADEDYKSALKYADATQRELYVEQANEIERIQKAILSLAQKEESYDIFICYKETDSNGKRTHDSAIANDIYHQLTQEGFKVFYAAITLEGKLGSAYEPIIFSALHSAKVMLVVGTKPEYFNAVWVKNEWSRFLKQIKNDRKKLLIPCFRDMESYELPEEFAHLQAQDMSKIGFINDLVRGIKKVVKKEEPKQTATKETTNTNANADPLLKRAFMFLEDGDFESANEYCEKVLDQNPECAEAYLGKLIIGFGLSDAEGLSTLGKPFDNDVNYKRAIKYGDEKFKERLLALHKACLDNIEKAKEEERRRLAEQKEREERQARENVYNKACKHMADKTEYGYINAISLFNSISDHRDASSLLQECEKRIEEIRIEKENKRIESEKRAKKKKKIVSIVVVIALLLVFIGSAIALVVNFVIVPNNKYNSAVSLMNEGDYLSAAEIFAELDGYKDSKDKIDELSPILSKQAEEAYFSGNAKEAANIAKAAGLPKAEAYRRVAEGDYETAVNLGLTNIVIPNGVTRIGGYAFYDCSSLTSITIPNSVTSIGISAFSNCSSLTSITIPNSVTSIDTSAFYNCSSLTSITIPDSVTKIGDYAFKYCSSLKSITIPSSVTSIGAHTFEDCSNLTSITISDSVTSIGYRAFSGCESLTSITIPDSVTSIGSYAFYNCSSLTSITIPDSITRIGESAFFYCFSLKSITLPDSITSISNCAFYYCSNLTKINFNGTKSQWSKISKGSNWNGGMRNYTVYCTDGTTR